MARMPNGRLGPPPWSFAADAHGCIMVLVRLDQPHTSSWRDAAPVGGLPLRSLWLTRPGAPCRGPQTEPDDEETGGNAIDKKSPIQVHRLVRLDLVGDRAGLPDGAAARTLPVSDTF